MYGIEAAVVGLACVFALVALWSAPWWMRVLSGLWGRFFGKLDQVDEVTDPKVKVIPKEER